MQFKGRVSIGATVMPSNFQICLYGGGLRPCGIVLFNVLWGIEMTERNE